MRSIFLSETVGGGEKSAAKWTPAISHWEEFKRGQRLKNCRHTAHQSPHRVVSQHLWKNGAANSDIDDAFILCIGFALVA